MNSKTAKRTRQLVKHLMTQGAIAEQGWYVLSPNVRHDQKQVVVGKVTNKDGVETNITKIVNTLTTGPENSVFTGTVRLDPACGRKIYQSMKKAARSHSTR